MDDIFIVRFKPGSAADPREVLGWFQARIVMDDGFLCLGTRS